MALEPGACARIAACTATCASDAMTDNADVLGVNTTSRITGMRRLHRMSETRRGAIRSERPVSRQPVEGRDWHAIGPSRSDAGPTSLD